MKYQSTQGGIMAIEQLKSTVLQYVKRSDILFVTWNGLLNNSADIDVYIVTKKNSISRVDIFPDKSNMWHELFIDTIDDLQKKLKNYDEIVINFLIEFDFAFGNKKLYQEYLSAAEKRRQSFNNFPEHRKNIILYRIKVLSSKLADISNDQITKIFLRNSLVYHIAYYLLVSHNQLPSSPKRWITQLQESLKPEEFAIFKSFVDGSMSNNQAIIYAQTIAHNIPELHIDKSISDNSLTFLS